MMSEREWQWYVWAFKLGIYLWAVALILYFVNKAIDFARMMQWN